MWKLNIKTEIFIPVNILNIKKVEKALTVNVQKL